MEFIGKQIYLRPEIRRTLLPLWPAWALIAIGTVCGTIMLKSDRLTDGWQAVLLAGFMTGGFSLLTVLCYWAFGDSHRPYSKELHAVLNPTYTYYPLSVQGQLLAALESNDEVALEAVKRQSFELVLVRYSDRDERVFYSQLLRIEGRGYILLTDIIINHKQPSK